jgi:hypothetical protein
MRSLPPDHLFRPVWKAALVLAIQSLREGEKGEKLRTNRIRSNVPEAKIERSRSDKEFDARLDSEEMRRDAGRKKEVDKRGFVRLTDLLRKKRIVRSTM